MTGTVEARATSVAKQVTLAYDDKEPFTDFKPMPYCLQDPRGATATGNSLRMACCQRVDGEEATSCIVEGHQTVDGDGNAANAIG